LNAPFSQVEDTRLHIAKLTVQLRNAKELAAARDLDTSNWVRAADHHALVGICDGQKRECEALRKETVHLKDENGRFAELVGQLRRERARAQEEAVEREVQLREELDKTHKEVQEMQMHTRLLESRADKMQTEMELKRRAFEEEAHARVAEAMGVMDDQRDTFNHALEERDKTIKQGRQDVEALQQALAAAEAARAAAEAALAELKRSATERALNMQPAEAQTFFQRVDKPLPDPTKAFDRDAFLQVRCCFSPARVPSHSLTGVFDRCR
jgi:myosin heavy subunit